MKNYGHRFACGVVVCFFTSIGCILKNRFGFDFFVFCKNIPLVKDNDLMPATLLAIFSFPFAVFLDNLVEKYELSIEVRDRMYLSVMIGSIVIAALSFII